MDDSEDSQPGKTGTPPIASEVAVIVTKYALKVSSSEWAHREAPHCLKTAVEDDRALFESHDGIAHAALHYAGFWPGAELVAVSIEIPDPPSPEPAPPTPSE